MINNMPTSCDGYKIDHRRQYPNNTTLIFSNFTSRGSRIEGLNKVIFFGLQYFIKQYLIEDWTKEFFDKPVEDVVGRYNRRVSNLIGPNKIGDQHIRDLHELGYLPLEIWALPEGSNVNTRVPMFVVWNTDNRFYWLTNAIETLLSTTIWLPCTSATTALMYRKLIDKWVNKTNPEMKDFVPWMAHDFSFRGHSSYESAMTSGAGHLLSFTGTDTIPAIDFLECYYNADSDKEIVGGSVAATEHSVSCMGSKYIDGVPDDYEYFERMITEVYPDGIISLVSDTFDLFGVLDPNGGILARLKDKIMSRDGKVVIRPDSGDPVTIVCGIEVNNYDTNTTINRIEDVVKWESSILEDMVICETPHGESGVDNISSHVIYGGITYKVEIDIEWNRYDKQYYYVDGYKSSFKEVELTAEQKGLIQCLWEIFGGTITSTGFKQLDSHISAIYGDAITLDRAEQMGKRLSYKGFAMTNLVLGVGSFTYNGAVTPDGIVTRDLHQFAMKSTYGEVLEDGVIKGIEIFKNPKTDSGMKKSAKGLTAVYMDDDGEFTLKDQASWDDVKNCAFVNVFSDGVITHEWNMSEIRGRVEKNF